MPGAISGAVTGHSVAAGPLTGSGTLNAKYNAITLHWTAAADTVDGYNVYRGPSAGAESSVPLNSSLIVGTSYTDAAPLTGTNYYIIKSSLGGVLSVIANEVGISISTAASTGHSAVSGLLRAFVNVHSTIAGHSAVSGSITQSHLAGQSAVAGTLKGVGVIHGASAGHAAVSLPPRGKGVLASSVTGQSSVSGTASGNVCHIAGHSAVSSLLRATGTRVSTVAGHSVVTASLKATAVAVSHPAGHSSVSGSAQYVGIAGHSVVSGAIKGLGRRISNVAGQSAVSVSGRLSGRLISAVAGHSAVSGYGSAAYVKVVGTAAVSGTLAASGAAVSPIIGHGGLVSGLGSTALPGIIGHAVVAGTLDDSAGHVASSCSGHSILTGSVVASIIRPIARGFGCDSANPSVVMTTSNSVQMFTQAYTRPFNQFANQPVVSTPNGFGILGQKIMPNMLLVAPQNGRQAWSTKPYTVFANGVVIIPASALNAAFSIILYQNYFGVVNDVAVLTSRVPLTTVPAYTAQSVSPSTLVGWSFRCGLPGGLGIIQLSIGVQFEGQLYNPSDVWTAEMTGFELR
jgi:hypothetical protein